MVHPYLRRRAGEEPVIYPNDAIREVLHKTLGVPIFQEQAMRLAVVAAGFTPGEADQLRRAMGAWRRPGVIDRFRDKLLDGMQQRGLSEEFAEQVFRQIRGFGEYGFPESHAASFALLVYVSAWLKHYYPAAFAAALINSQPMGFYAPSQLVRDARQHGVHGAAGRCQLQRLGLPLEPLGGNAPGETARQLRHERQGRRSKEVRPHPSDRPLPPVADAGPESGRLPTSPTGRLALRLGFRLLKGLPQTAAQAIERAREVGGPFRALADFTRRTALSRALVVKLSEADVFQSLSRDRRTALWEALSQERTGEHLPLLDILEAHDEPPAELPALSPQEDVYADYLTAGLSLKAHPISFHRELLGQMNVVPAEKLRYLPNGRRVCVAGLVLLRQRPSTAKGITFVTLEDETGTTNLLVHQSTWERYYRVAKRSAAWLAHGHVECKDTVIHVIVQRLEDLSSVLGNVSIRSRDFR